jgi:threonine dehydratase
VLSVSKSGVDVAWGRIREHVRLTPVMSLKRGALGGEFVPVLKLELMQLAGSFKARGAFNTLLSQEIPEAGVAAASGGNHGAAVALAAKRLGVKATIFVPEISSPAKMLAIRSQGAELVVGGARYADAQAACDRFVAESGARPVHPYEAVGTIEGQGTLATEWDAQLAQTSEKTLDSVLVAVGGGGLVAGMALWWQGAVKVIAVEPEGSSCLKAALAAGGPVDVSVDSVAADSLGARRIGETAFAIAQQHVARSVVVPDEAILQAQAMLWRDFRIAAEPGGATALAALLAGAYRPAPGERVGILVCGGNVDLARLAALF